MKKYFFYCLIITLLYSCSSDPPPSIFKSKIRNISVKSAPKKKFTSIKKKNSKLINNYNVRRKLNEFARNHSSNKLQISTKYGKIIVKLYDETPLHRANFLMLAKKGFFDSTLFYRVINNFMIQGGNSDKDNMLHKMAKIGNYKIPPEINKKYIHKRGALAMAVQEQYFMDTNKYDPASSPYNFYIVQKGPISNSYMEKIENKYKIKIPEKDKLIYKSIGGNPHLDNRYTVFGEVIKGMDVVDKIASVITNEKNRPLKNVYLTMQIVN